MNVIWRHPDGEELREWRNDAEGIVLVGQAEPKRGLGQAEPKRELTAKTLADGGYRRDPACPEHALEVVAPAWNIVAIACLRCGIRFTLVADGETGALKIEEARR